jgi:hypothetical protein
MLEDPSGRFSIFKQAAALSIAALLTENYSLLSHNISDSRPVKWSGIMGVLQYSSGKNGKPWSFAGGGVIGVHLEATDEKTQRHVSANFVILAIGYTFDFGDLDWSFSTLSLLTPGIFGLKPETVLQGPTFFGCGSISGTLPQLGIPIGVYISHLTMGMGRTPNEYSPGGHFGSDTGVDIHWGWSIYIPEKLFIQ